MLIDRINNAPDFMLSDGGLEIGLEAVTVGRKTPAKYFTFGEPEFKVPSTKELENDMPLKWGSPLFSKLSHKNKDDKHYWEYEHTKNKPFVIVNTITMRAIQ